MVKDKMRPRRIEVPFPEERILDDLERYRSLAIELGATDAKVITATELRVDERVRAKCLFPKCSQYGTNANCPPHVPDVTFTRRLLRRYRYGLIFSSRSETKHYLGEGYKRGQPTEAKKALERVLSELESTSYYEGYYFSVAFGQGSCKSIFCASEECSVLLGRGCRSPLRARPSMEAIGIDVFDICVKCGWEVYPCGRRLGPEDVPHVLLVGLVLVC